LEGTIEGEREGSLEETTEGKADKVIEGNTEGEVDEAIEEDAEGEVDKVIEGCNDLETVGGCLFIFGAPDGTAEGTSDCFVEENTVGVPEASVGESVPS